MIGRRGGAAVPDPDWDVVRNPRARRLRLSVNPVSGRVRLTLPPRLSLAKALDWANGQAAWIERQRAGLPESRPFAPGATIPFDGATLLIAWDEGHRRLPHREGDRLCVGGPESAVPRRVKAWLERQALALLTVETQECARRAGVTVSAVGTGDPRGRWGSCTASGTIRYSWRLILAPPEVRRATVAHEVAHRLHMDHSPAFHAAVARLFGREPAAERQWLRAHGATLHWFGRGGEEG